MGQLSPSGWLPEEAILSMTIPPVKAGWRGDKLGQQSLLEKAIFV
jgi:hypothetical protein